METLAEIIRSLFILTFIGALTYRFVLTLFFIYYHHQYIKYEATIPAIIYLLASYAISIIGLAVFYNKIYHIEKKCRTICAKLVEICYALAAITFGSVLAGAVIKFAGVDTKITQTILPSNNLNYALQYGQNQHNILRWYQASVIIVFSVFILSLIVICTDLSIKGYEKVKLKWQNKIQVQK